jgi:hypothetical protein
VVAKAFFESSSTRLKDWSMRGLLDLPGGTGEWLADGEKYLNFNVDAACTSRISYVCKFSCIGKKS